MNKRIDFSLAGTDQDDENHNTSGNGTFMDVLDARLSRRSVLRGGVGGAAVAVLGGFGLVACGGGGGGDDDDDEATGALESLAFAAVPKNIEDTVTVPAGYTASVIYALGDPLTATTPAYKNDGTDTDFDNRAGDHHDGMEYFGLNAAGTARDADSSERGLLAINHEALTDNFLHPAGTSPRPRPAAESDKEIPAHGLSVVEVRRTGGAWSTVQGSAFNRRVTPATPVELSGAARGNALMKTKFSTAGTQTRGTINNCGTGYTPWGTFLTGEENWAGYFARNAGDIAIRGAVTEKSNVSLRRYGNDPRTQRVGSVSKTVADAYTSRHGWETSGSDDQYQRWNISQIGASVDGSDDYRNELNGFGYIVELDPYDKTAAVKKRTSLGRFAHESGSFGRVSAGKPLVVYQGDDSIGEYIYKFVSAASWSDADAEPADRMSTGDKYLDTGKLFVARFDADGTGSWIDLDIANTAIAGYTAYDFADQADVLVNARLAADAVGATRMDRPEWCAVPPTTGEVYYTLTNNSSRKVDPSPTQFALDAANPRSYTDVKDGTPPVQVPAGNINGHVIRLRENADEGAATAFTWDVYLFGAQSDADANLVNLSSLTADQDFSSPDGLWFSRSTGLCWIQTDDGAYTDVTNCMMVVGVPGAVGDGVKKTLAYPLAAGGTLNVDTYVGKKPTADTLKRFLVGPVQCEITGLTETPDGKTVFCNIQHPGESIQAADVVTPSEYGSHWPGNAGYGAGGADARPRSATIAIIKNDGGRVGS
ncbi:MAG: PhoX family phosphatase [Methylibium sp.]|nr:PhoX family phosphatase [Methylibium sp.]